MKVILVKPVLKNKAQEDFTALKQGNEASKAYY